jgi:hypothetical protein
MRYYPLMRGELECRIFLMCHNRVLRCNTIDAINAGFLTASAVWICAAKCRFDWFLAQRRARHFQAGQRCERACPNCRRHLVWLSVDMSISGKKMVCIVYSCCHWSAGRLTFAQSHLGDIYCFQSERCMPLIACINAPRPCSRAARCWCGIACRMSLACASTFGNISANKARPEGVQA